MIQNLCALIRRTEGIEHVAVTLGMNGFLKSLDCQAQIDLVGRDHLADIRQVGRLNTVKKDQKRQCFIERCLDGWFQLGIILEILAEIDFLRNPEIIHRLTVPVGHPAIFQRVEVVEVGRVAVDHPAPADIGIALGVKQSFAFE